MAAHNAVTMPLLAVDGVTHVELILCLLPLGHAQAFLTARWAA